MAETVPAMQWIERWCYILGSHRPSQLGWRALRLLERRVFPLLPKRTYLRSDPSVSTVDLRGFDLILSRHLELRLQKGDYARRLAELGSGEFCFLNERRQLGSRGRLTRQVASSVSHLWRFHLQYHEFLLDLLAAGEDDSDSRDQIRETLTAWITEYPLTRKGVLGDAWHPFCLSRRIPVWLLLWHAGAIPDEVRNEVAQSLESQIRFLESHLEWDLRGNHIWENLRALILAGAFWRNASADRRLDRGCRLMKQQFGEQLLPSGEHFERSPMYHAQMLSAALDMRDATAGLRPEFSRHCQTAVDAMAGFLERCLHPDGQIPLLGDSAIDETPSPQILLQAAQESGHDEDSRPTSAEEAESGSVVTDADYWRWREGQNLLLFDHGAVAADELPAHAHNDLLTIEASLTGRRLIVDSGVFDYADSEMRRYCRSTAAHNVLQVGQAEQCDLWSRFRMGRRGRPRNLRRGCQGEFSWVAAEHDGFRGLGVPTVGRWIACRSNGPWIFVDWAASDGNHELTNWLHFAPDVDVSTVNAGELQLRFADRDAVLRYLTAGTLQVHEGWYCPEFGVRQPNRVAGFIPDTANPAVILWSLEWGRARGTVTASHREDRDEIVWEDENQRVCWSLDDIIGSETEQ